MSESQEGILVLELLFPYLTFGDTENSSIVTTYQDPQEDMHILELLFPYLTFTDDEKVQIAAEKNSNYFCPICQKDIESPEPFTTGPGCFCTSTGFHQKCLESYLKSCINVATCPCCRVDWNN